MKLFESFSLGEITLQNRVVMAPMTRSRALGNIPTDLMAEYYGQRVSNGLIITEGTSPSPNGLGYPRIPGIFSAEQIAGWKKVTDAVHAKGGKIFVQIMHTGRVTVKENLPEGAEVVAPSAVKLNETQMWVDAVGGMVEIPAPRALETEEIKAAVQEYVSAAKNAIEAGFDGVELHGANGYFLEQFIHPATNQRTDEYGGSIENRLRFVVETAKAVVEAIGVEKTGIRLSPYGVFNEMPPYAEIDETYTLLAQKLSELNLVYVHLVDHASMGTPEVPTSVKESIRTNFKNTLILSGGYDKARAEADLQAGNADLIAFGRPALANPDFVARLKADATLNEADHESFYGAPTAEGYTDYPTLEEANA